jgi:hypothetical protein
VDAAGTPMIELLLAAALTWQMNGPEVMRRCQEADDRNAEMERNYVFQQRTEDRFLDAKGVVTSKHSETFDTILTGGRPYQRLIARDDKPLTPAEEKKEIARQHREESQRKEEERRARDRDLAHDAVKAFQVKIIGEDSETWALEATPKPGFQPHSRETAVLKHFRGRIWISKKDYVWTRLDAEAMEDVSFGFVLFRLSKGAHLVFERTHVNGEVWLPQRITGSGEVRIALVKKVRMEFETTCSKFKRYSADARIVEDPVK